MDTGTLSIVIAVLGGGVGLEIVRVIFKGWQQRARARGRVRGAEDALHMARRQWIEAAHEQRLVAINAGGTPPPLPTEDAWLDFEKNRDKLE